MDQHPRRLSNLHELAQILFLPLSPSSLFSFTVSHPRASSIHPHAFFFWHFVCALGACLKLLWLLELCWFDVADKASMLIFRNLCRIGGKERFHNGTHTYCCTWWQVDHSKCVMPRDSSPSSSKDKMGIPKKKKKQYLCNTFLPPIKKRGCVTLISSFLKRHPSFGEIKCKTDNNFNHST